MRTGLDPVGRPRTNGCSGVGLKFFILSFKAISEGIPMVGPEGRHIPMIYLAM